MKSYIRRERDRYAVSLMDHLADIGIEATVGVSDGRTWDRVLYAYVRRGNMANVPAEWMGLKVIAKDACELDRQEAAS